MEARYRITFSKGIFDAMTNLRMETENSLRAYLKGLEDAGAIRSGYSLVTTNPGFFSTNVDGFLIMEISNESVRDQIDTTLRRTYRAIQEPVTQIV